MQTQTYLIFNAKFRFPGSSDLWNKTQGRSAPAIPAVPQISTSYRTEHNVSQSQCWWYLLSLQRFIQVCDKAGSGTKVRSQGLSVQSQDELNLSPHPHPPHQPGSPAFQALRATLSRCSAQQPLQLSTLLTRITGPLTLPGPITRTAAEASPLCNLSYNYGQQHLGERGVGGHATATRRVPDGLHDSSCHLMQSRLFCSKSGLNISLIHADRIQPAPQPFAMAHVACSRYFSPLGETEKLWNW